MDCGIYKIQNKINNKFYIGSSKCLSKRKTIHFVLLRHGLHHNGHLQASFNKYGESNFSFIILLYCDESNLYYFEQTLIDGLKPQYNKRLDASTNRGIIRNKELTKIRVKKISKIWPGLISPSGEVFESIFNLNEFCRNHSLDYRSIYKVLKGDRNYHMGWVSYNKSTFNSKRGRPPKTYVGLVSPEGVIYKDITNMRKFCNDHSLSCSNIYSLLNGNIKQVKGWTRPF